MFDFLKEIQILREEGKLHSRLLTRLRILFGIAIVLAGAVIFNVIYRNANAMIVFGLFALGLVAGIFLFSRMSVIQWNEEKEVVETGRIDLIGYGMIALYIVFEIGLRTYLNDFFPVSATVFIFAAVSGALLGRSFGTLIEIHRVFKATHPDHGFSSKTPESI